MHQGDESEVQPFPIILLIVSILFNISLTFNFLARDPPDRGEVACDITTSNLVNCRETLNECEDQLKTTLHRLQEALKK